VVVIRNEHPWGDQDMGANVHFETDFDLHATADECVRAHRQEPVARSHIEPDIPL
jgi:hypothetical protein